MRCSGRRASSRRLQGLQATPQCFPRHAGRRLRAEVSAAARELPLSAGQKGLYIVQKLHPGISAYNVPLCFRVNSDVDGALLAIRKSGSFTGLRRGLDSVLDLG